MHGVRACGFGPGRRCGRAAFFLFSGDAGRYRGGDLAAPYARSEGWRGSSFQVLDPATARFVPKSNYVNLHRGWQACIAEPVLVHREPLSRVPDAMRWWALVLVCGAAGASLLALQWSLDQRSAMSRTLETFGAAFIREFERPLLDERTPGPSLRTRLALSPDSARWKYCSPRRRESDIRTWPTIGRTWINVGAL